jgi:hypothetical protein
MVCAGSSFTSGIAFFFFDLAAASTAGASRPLMRRYRLNAYQ